MRAVFGHGGRKGTTQANGGAGDLEVSRGKK
jgi:hypothetical protein